MKGLLIESVTSGSIAEELEVEAGDRLIAINGRELRDLIDYSYYLPSDHEIQLEIQKPDGELWQLEFEWHHGESLGLVFSPPKPASCANNCVFCFVHQLPRGLRKQLYVKDEDFRLSFLNGNYVTLANLKSSQLSRIIQQRLSPLYISVHTTNPALREQMLGTRGIPPILSQLRELAAARMVLHTQVVLCPGLNDGAELERTVNDLAGLYPAVRSLAVVPVGLTGHRRTLPLLKGVDSSYARDFLATWEPISRKLRRKLGGAFLLLADEFFLKGGVPFPPIREYGDFPQLENGVGLVPLFSREAGQTLRRARPVGAFRATVVTGMSAGGFVGEFLMKLGEKTGVDLQMIPVRNRLFGESVTVSGLVAGNDILAAVEGRDPGSVLMVPDVMLKEGAGLFLDDVTCSDLQARIGCPVIEFDSSPGGCYRALREFSRRK